MTRYTEKNNKHEFIDIDVNAVIEKKYKIFKNGVDYHTENQLDKKIKFKQQTNERWSFNDLVDNQLHEYDDYNGLVLDIWIGVIDKIKSNGYLMSKKRYLSIVFMKMSYQEKEDRRKIFETMHRGNDISFAEYMKEYTEIYQDTRDESWIENNKEGYTEDMNDIKFLQNKIDNNDWVTVYRGFNTKNEESIRFSNNKNKKNTFEYFKQKEGLGFSFSLSKHIAFAFSCWYQIRKMDDFLLEKDITRADDDDYKKLHDFVTFFRDQHYKQYEYGLDLDKLIGRLTIGRFVVHSSKIFAFGNHFGEREIMCDYNDAKLIDYQFLSNDKQFSVDVSRVNLKDLRNYMFHEIKDDKNLWINNNWKEEYKVTEELESMF